MSSASKSSDFFKSLSSVIDSKTKPDWFILKELDKHYEGNKDLHFSFHDGPRTREYPFQAHQGYLCVEASAEKDFRQGFIEFVRLYKGNELALCNIYIVLSQISSNDKFTKSLEDDFKAIIDGECETIYNRLIVALNKDYFNHHHYWGSEPKTVQDWLDIFRSSQGFHNITDPVIDVKKLVQPNKRLHLAYRHILVMKPLLRATLMGWYNFQLEATTEEVLQAISTSPTEAAFVAASILDDIGPERKAPAWLNREIVEVFVKKYWETIGKALFVHVYGISYRNQNENELFKSLQQLLHEVILERIQPNDATDVLWLQEFDLPDTYIAFFWWAIENDVPFTNVPKVKRDLITTSLLTAVQKIVNDLVTYVAPDNNSDPFRSTEFLNEKYQRTLGYVLLYLLDAPDNNIKQLSSICFAFKPMYYGGYEANLIASRFTDFILLVVLSIDHLKDLSQEMRANLKKILDIIGDSVLIPYVHLSERSSDIWDIDSKRETSYYNASKDLVNDKMKRTIGGAYTAEFNDFFSLMNEIKVAQWPFERN
ncbi:hypothetical protein [Pedobacter insulae]|uniref:Uncharacterized protein n=1 Tax=Pedobacter insulae TaxID=414048 RepID=A0A1I2ZI53_9SPHI|nr:hypothetical protein [Pedobacter insulae]SFH37527.1 hypothetical protein SAMN04489864_11048 [Pedobacter insulae]